MKQKIILLIGLIIILSSCKTSDNILHKTTPIFKIEAPSSGKINETVNIEVYFGASNGCTSFRKFNETENSSFVRTISLETQQPKNAFCTDNAPILHQTYSFTPTLKGTYTLKFWSGNSQYISTDILVD